MTAKGAQFLEAFAAADGSKYDPTRKAKADTIICPALAVLYANHDLECNEDGTLTREQLVEACMRLGSSRFNANILADQPAKAIGPDFSIFKLAGTPVVHISSTAIRNPGPPSKALFEKLASFADKDGRLYGRQLYDAANYFSAHPPAHANPKGPATVDFMLYSACVVFGNVQGYFTVDDLRRIFLEARYPEGWVVRQWGLKNVLSWMLYWKTVGPLISSMTVPMIAMTMTAIATVVAVVVAVGVHYASLALVAK